jgi:hypothetical protein
MHIVLSTYVTISYNYTNRSEILEFIVNIKLQLNK